MTGCTKVRPSTPPSTTLARTRSATAASSCSSSTWATRRASHGLAATPRTAAAPASARAAGDSRLSIARETVAGPRPAIAVAVAGWATSCPALTSSSSSAPVRNGLPPQAAWVAATTSAQGAVPCGVWNAATADGDSASGSSRSTYGDTVRSVSGPVPPVGGRVATTRAIGRSATRRAR